MKKDQVKVQWQGEVVSVQPRSTVWRYLTDNRTHRECGYNIFLKGEVCGDQPENRSDKIEEGTAPVTRDGWMRYALSTGTIRMSKRRILFRSGICLVLISQPPVAGFPSLVDSMQPSVKG